MIGRRRENSFCAFPRSFVITAEAFQQTQVVVAIRIELAGHAVSLNRHRQKEFCLRSVATLAFRHHTIEQSIGVLARRAAEWSRATCGGRAGGRASAHVVVHLIDWDATVGLRLLITPERGPRQRDDQHYERGAGNNPWQFAPITTTAALLPGYGSTTVIAETRANWKRGLAFATLGAFERGPAFRAK
jgi:hypothetical protein